MKGKTVENSHLLAPHSQPDSANSRILALMQRCIVNSGVWQPSMSVFVALVVILILLGVNALLAFSEASILNARKSSLRERADDGDRAAIRLLQLLESPSQLLATIQVGSVLVGYAAAAVGAYCLVRALPRPAHRQLGRAGGRSRRGGRVSDRDRGLVGVRASCSMNCCLARSRSPGPTRSRRWWSDRF